MKSPVDQRTGSSILQYKETDDVNTINEHIKTALGNQGDWFVYSDRYGALNLNPVNPHTSSLERC